MPRVPPAHVVERRTLPAGGGGAQLAGLTPEQAQRFRAVAAARGLPAALRMLPAGLRDRIRRQLRGSRPDPEPSKGAAQQTEASLARAVEAEGLRRAAEAYPDTAAYRDPHLRSLDDDGVKAYARRHRAQLGDLGMVLRTDGKKALDKLRLGKALDDVDPADLLRKAMRREVTPAVATASLYVGLLLPEPIAGLFPPRGEQDTSAPHVTVVYALVPEAQAAEAYAAVRAAVRRWDHAPQLVLDRLDYFDPPDGDRVAVVAVLDTGIYRKGLMQLRGAIFDALDAAGVPYALTHQGEYRPHATLAYIPAGTEWDGVVPMGSAVCTRASVSVGAAGGEDTVSEDVALPGPDAIASMPPPPREFVRWDILVDGDVVGYWPAGGGRIEPARRLRGQRPVLDAIEDALASGASILDAARDAGAVVERKWRVVDAWPERAPGPSRFFSEADLRALARTAKSEPAATLRKAAQGDGFKIGPPPSPNRKEYPFVGSVALPGKLFVDVETRRGEKRSGTDADGHAWSVVMPAHYGEIRDTAGTDGDPLDVFLGSDPWAAHVYVIAIQDPSTGKHDEDKAFIGFATRDAAEATFRAAYDRRDLHLGTRRMTYAEFVDWCHSRATRQRRITGGSEMAKSVDAGAVRALLRAAQGAA